MCPHNANEQMTYILEKALYPWNNLQHRHIYATLRKEVFGNAPVKCELVHLCGAVQSDLFAWINISL